MSANVVRGTEQEEECGEVCKMNRSSIAWKSAGNFINSFKRIQTFFRRLSLAPSDFFLFPKMKIELKGRKFDTVEEIHSETQTILNTRTEKHFQDSFQKCQKRCDRRVRYQEDYFEGDGAE
jgi:hypothetical protein